MINAVVVNVDGAIDKQDGIHYRHFFSARIPQRLPAARRRHELLELYSQWSISPTLKEYSALFLTLFASLFSLTHTV